MRKNKCFFLLTVIVIFFVFPNKVTAAGAQYDPYWDVKGYSDFKTVESNYFRNFATQPWKNKNGDIFEEERVGNVLTFLPGPGKIRDYVTISQGNAEYVTLPEDLTKKISFGAGDKIKIQNIGFHEGSSLTAILTIGANVNIKFSNKPNQPLLAFFNGSGNVSDGHNLIDFFALNVVKTKTEEPIKSNGQYFIFNFSHGIATVYDGYPSAYGYSGKDVKLFQSKSLNLTKTTKLPGDISIITHKANHRIGNDPNIPASIEYPWQVAIPIGEETHFYFGLGASFGTTISLDFFDNRLVNTIPKTYANIEVTGKESTDDKKNAEFSVKHHVYKQPLANYYPINGISYMPLEGNENENLTIMSVLDKAGKPIAYNYDENSGKITISNAVLKQLGDNEINLNYATNLDYVGNYDLITDYYNQETNEFDIPFNLDVILGYETESSFTIEHTQSIPYPVNISAKSKELTVAIGESTDDYELQDFIDMDSIDVSYPNEEVKKNVTVQLKNKVLFDKVGQVPVTILLYNSDLNVTQELTIMVNVTSEPISYSDKVSVSIVTEEKKSLVTLVQDLPAQQEDKYYPDDLSYSFYNQVDSYSDFMNLDVVKISVANSNVPGKYYHYNKETGVLKLTKSLLKDYKNQKVTIELGTNIDWTKDSLLDFMTKESISDKLLFTSAFHGKVSATNTMISQGDSKSLECVGESIPFSLDYKIPSHNLKVIVGKTIGDYELTEYVDVLNASTGLKAIDKLLTVSLSTPKNEIIDTDTKNVTVLLKAQLPNGLDLATQLDVSIQPIMRKEYTIEMVKQKLPLVTNKNVDFSMTLKLLEQDDEVAYPDKIELIPMMTADQLEVAKPSFSTAKLNGANAPAGDLYTYSENRFIITVPKKTLIEQAGKELVFTFKTNFNYSPEKTLDLFYDVKTKNFNVSSVGAKATQLFSNEERVESLSLTQEDYHYNYPYKLNAMALTPSYPAGTSTEDNLDISTFVNNLTIDYPLKKVKEDLRASFPKEVILFSKEGTIVNVPITIESQIFDIKKVIMVPVNVTKEIKLSFQSFPKELNILDFSTENKENGFGSGNKKGYYLKGDSPLLISDTRNQKSWTISMIPSKIYGQKDDPLTKDKELMGNFVKRSPNEVNPNSFNSEEMIAGEEYHLYSAENIKDEIVDVSSMWENATKTQGVLFENKNSSNYKGSYEGSITWLLSDVAD